MVIWGYEKQAVLYSDIQFGSLVFLKNRIPVELCERLY